MLTDRFGSNVYLDWLHHKVHMSRIFSASYSNTVGGSGTVKIHITTGTNGAHFDVSISANKSGVVVFSEADTVTGSSALTAFNNDRNSSVTPSATLAYDGTISVAGTTLRTIIVGSGGASGARIGGEARTNLEYILKPSTTYSVVFTADGAATTASLNCDFYEA